MGKKGAKWKTTKNHWSKSEERSEIVEGTKEKNWMSRPDRDEIIERIREKNKGKHFSPATEFKKGDVRLTAGDNFTGWKGKFGKDSAHYKGIPEWVAKRQGKYFCHCGCGQAIQIISHHYHVGIPEFILGHNKGERASNWRGGITSLLQQIRHCPKIREWREAVFRRDNYTCQRCRIKNGNGKTTYLEAHHRKSFRQIIGENNITDLEQALECKELWEVNNGLTLCGKCHDKTKWGRNFNKVEILKIGT